MTASLNDDDRSLAENARRRALHAYEQARDSMTDARRKAKGSLADAPLIALAGGLAAGALLAALLPRTEKEAELIGPTAKRIKDAARAAADAARETGSQQLSELGLDREKGGDAIRSLLQDVTDAAKASASAAAEAVRKS